MRKLRVPSVKTRDDVVWVVFCVVVCEGEVCVSAAVCEVAADGRRRLGGGAWSSRAGV